MKSLLLSGSVLAFALLACSGLSRSQEPQTAPGVQNSGKTCYLRVRLVGAGDKSEPVTVEMQPSSGERKKLVDSAIPKGIISTPYEPIPSGQLNLDILSRGERKTLSQEVREKGFYTLLLYPHDGYLVPEFLRDTFSESDLSLSNLRVLNFGSSREAQIQIGGEWNIDVMSNTFFQRRVQTKGLLPLRVVVPDPAGGCPAVSTGEVQLSGGRSTTIVIMPDYRGKFRPRVWQDGVTE